VLAADIDPFCHAAVALNAAANKLELDFTAEDLVGTDGGCEVLLAGDVFYDRALAGRLVHWFAALAWRGATVLIGDPGRSYLPRERLEKLAVYQVPVTRALEDAEVKRTTVWRFA
jgi:predicted nicotinamide N-methyase